MLDLPAEHAAIAAELSAAIERVLVSGRFILGPEVEALEHEIAAACGAARAIACASGSDALYLALRALGVGPGDEVITSSFSFIATAEAIARAGARPIFADIEPETFAIDPASILARATARTKVIVPVHLFGHTAPMVPIMELARSRGWFVVEDAAQAIGARAEDGRLAGSIGELAALSFFPTKNLGALGDGGMVLANGPRAAEHAALITSLRVHGTTAEVDRYDRVGLNSRLDALQAAVLRVKLRQLSKWTEARRENANRYSELLSGLRLPKERPGARHVFNQYTIRASDRDALRERLRAAGIASAVYYSRPLHRQPCFADLRPSDCPEADRAAREVLSLPIHPQLTREQVERVAKIVRSPS